MSNLRRPGRTPSVDLMKYLPTLCCLGLSLVASACAVEGGSHEEGAASEGSLRTPDDPLYDPNEPVPGHPRNPPPASPGLVANEFASIEDVPLWLIELEVKTADVDDAGTDDTVSLRMKT